MKDAQIKIEELTDETIALLCADRKKTICFTSDGDEVSMDLDETNDLATIVNLCRAGSNVQVISDEFLSNEEDEKYIELLSQDKDKAIDYLYSTKSFDELVKFLDLISEPHESFNVKIKFTIIDSNNLTCVTISKKSEQ